MSVEGAGATFNIGRVIQRTFGLIRRNFVAFSALSLAFVGGPYLLILAFAAALVGGARGFDPSDGMNSAIVMVIVYFSCWLILLAALTRAAVDDLSRKSVSVTAAVRTGFAVLLPMLGLLLVYFGAMILGTILLSLGIAIGAAAGPILVGLLSLSGVVGGIYVVVRWLVSAPVLVVERPGVFASLRRSRALTENHRWAILGLTVLFLAFVFVLFTVISLLVPNVRLALTGSQFGLGSTLTIVVLVLRQAAVSMIGTALVASVYFELREIKEGVGVSELADVFS